MPGPPTVEPFRRISIRGLLNEGDFDLVFSNEGVLEDRASGDRAFFVPEASDFDPLRIVYGLNGSGKTSALSIIRALLQGDIPGLMSIPFHSVEIERWEPWGPEETWFERLPGGVDGLTLGSNSDANTDGTFVDNYVFLKFVTAEYNDSMGYDRSSITEETKAVIQDLLASNDEIRGVVEQYSEPDAFEIPICLANSHTFKLQRKKDGEKVWFEAEYSQDRSPYRFADHLSRDSVMELLVDVGMDSRSTTALVGKEVISRSELSIKSEGERARLASFLQEKGITTQHGEYLPDLSVLSRLQASEIRDLNESGIVDIMGIWRTWRSYNGDRRFWSDDSAIKWFEEEFKKSRQGDSVSIDWDRSTVSELSMVTLIGPNAETNDKEYISSEVERLQDLMRERRGHILRGLGSEEEMLATLRSAFSGEYDYAKVGEVVAKAVSIAFITENMSPNASDELGHLLTLPAILDGLQEEFPDSFAARQLGENSPRFAISLNRKFPFLSEMNESFLNNKSIKIRGDLGVEIITNSGETIPYNRLSHGELRLLYMLSIIGYRDIGGVRWPTVLIDEPEVGLHIDWQRKLVSAIKGFYNITEDGGQMGDPVKVVIATHSPEIVASSPEDAVSIEPMPEELR